MSDVLGQIETNLQAATDILGQIETNLKVAILQHEKKGCACRHYVHVKGNLDMVRKAGETILQAKDIYKAALQRIASEPMDGATAAHIADTALSSALWCYSNSGCSPTS